MLFDNLTLEMANIIEEELIKKYKSSNSKYGYNIASGGRNYKMSDETKEKLREKALGRTHSKETKEKIKAHWKTYGHPLKGKHHSEETRKKISKAKTGHKLSKEQIEKLREMYSGEGNPFYGKHHTDEIKDKLSYLAKERFENPENNPFYGKTHSEEAKKRMSDSHKNIPKEKHGRYGKPISPKAKEAMRKVNMKQVAQFDINNNFICYHESASKASEHVGCSKDAISKCCRGKSKTCMGYIFKYVDDIEKDVSRIG